jgi:methionyl-tRNA formyltransferase
MKLKIIFFGTPDFVIPVLNSVAKNFNVVGIVTAPDRPVGREQKLTPSPVKQHLLETHKVILNVSEGSKRDSSSSTQNDKKEILILTPEKFDESTTEQLQNLQPDLFVVAAYGLIIPKSVLEIPKLGALNVHPSLLPKYRGASPIQSAILNGDTISGISIIKMDEQMDHGPIVYTEEISLSDKDTFESLSKKMFEVAAEVLPEVIRQFTEGRLNPVTQDDQKAIFTKIIKKEDGYFDIENPPSPKILDRMTRAYYPWPGVWTRFNGKIVKFLPSSSHPELGSGSTKFLIQMEGKKPIKLEDFLHGYPDFPFKNLP